MLEGVACSLRATRDAIVDTGVRCDSWLATGNGLASPLWRSIVADVFGEPLRYVDSPERTGVGAALIAGIAAGVYADYAEASAAARPPLRSTEPTQRNRSLRRRSTPAICGSRRLLLRSRQSRLAES